jgi:hypothetical protein
MRKALLAGLTGVIALGLIAAPAQAKPKTVKVETQVTIDDNRGGVWEGHVSAAKPKCERNRVVELFYVGAGGPSSYGTATSEFDGSWSLDPDGKLIFGDYEARAAKRKVKKRKNGKVKKVFKCQAAVSPPVGFGP